MHTFNSHGEDPSGGGPLVFQVRQLRLFSGEGGLSQAHLAKLADISPRLLRTYESCRALPQSVHSLLRLAIALEVPFEGLFEPSVLEDLKHPIETRRAELAAKARHESSFGDG